MMERTPITPPPRPSPTSAAARRFTTIASKFVRCSFFAALSLPPTVFIGTIGGEDRDVLLWERTPGRIIGAALHGKGDPQFVSGTIQDNHIIVRDEVDAIDATVVWKTFDRRPYAWDLNGTWNGARFSFWNDNQTDRVSLLNYPNVAGNVPFDRLHDDLRANRWAAADIDAQLVCVTASNCDWIEAVRALAEHRKPPAREYAPWRVVLHERAGRRDLAEAAARRDCDGYSRIGCRFYLDYAKTREAYHLACQRAEIACDRYWGAGAIALIDASRQGDEAAVRRLAAKEVNVNAGGEAMLPTPLQGAAMSGSLPIMKLLVSRGANVDVPYPQSAWLSPLFYAINGKHEDVAIFLLEHGASIHRPGRDESLLWQAAYANEARVVHKMLLMGQDPDDTVPAGSPLTAAVKNRNLAMARDLLAHGADPDLETENSGGSPIDYARRMHQKKMLRLLLATRERP